MAQPSSQEREGQPQRRGAEPLDAVSLLQSDHAVVEDLFTRFEGADGRAADKQALTQQIFQALEAHTQIEEELFYPVVRAQVYKQGDNTVAESLQDHQNVKNLIHTLQRMNPDDPNYATTFRELIDNVRGHVDMEESEILPDTEKLLSDKLEQLGAQMQRRKQELMAATR